MVGSRTRNLLFISQVQPVGVGDLSNFFSQFCDAITDPFLHCDRLPKHIAGLLTEPVRTLCANEAAAAAAADNAAIADIGAAETLPGGAGVADTIPALPPWHSAAGGGGWWIPPEF